MRPLTRRRRPAELALESHGVGVGVVCEPGTLVEAVHKVLPPGWRERAADEVDARFTLSGDESSGYEVRSGEALLAASGDLDVALGVLDAKIRAEISTRASGWTFVHAGVVAREGRALVVPGVSFSGKTSLVRALIEAGASYYSDEYAVLDADGRVHPYPRPLSIRDGGGGSRTTELAAASLGAATGSSAAEIAVVALAPYRADAHWQPRRYSAAHAALALLTHAVVAREEPEDVMAVVSRAAANACLLEGERGEAEPTARALIQTLGWLG